MRNISKRFPGVTANDHVDFTLNSGEVHALLGENGAGKTTLMNILYGLYRPDGGEIWVKGRLATIRSPRDSISLGVAMVHQHFELVPTLTVAENVGLGLKMRRSPLLDLETVADRVSELSREYGLKVDPKARIEQLSMGERQRVEVVKALYRGAEILILDEPTSVLIPQEAGELFKLLRSMVAQGKAVVVITHKLPEVMAVSDRVTVLRHGSVVAELETRFTSPSELAEKMVGREIPGAERIGATEPGEILLELRDVSAMNEKGLLGLDHVSFALRGGEILGVAGVAGNGQTELAEVLTGMRRLASGSVVVEGKDLTNGSPRKMIEAGVGHIPEDRIGSALIMDLSIAENLILEVRTRPPFEKRYMLDEGEMRKHAKRLVAEYSIACSSVDAPARTLSGGNLQKIVLAKVLSRNPQILIAAQPTAGLDVGAARFISDKLRQQRAAGVGILLISGDLNEVMSLSDRIACMYDGKVMGIISAAVAELEKIGLMMGGVEAH